MYSLTQEFGHMVQSCPEILCELKVIMRIFKVCHSSDLLFENFHLPVHKLPKECARSFIELVKKLFTSFLIENEDKDCNKDVSLEDLRKYILHLLQSLCKSLDDQSASVSSLSFDFQNLKLDLNLNIKTSLNDKERTTDSSVVDAKKTKKNLIDEYDRSLQEEIKIKQKENQALLNELLSTVEKLRYKQHDLYPDFIDAPEDDIPVLPETFPEITEPELNLLSSIEDMDVNEVIAKNEVAEIKKDDILLLLNNSWINDNIINFYMRMIVSRSDENVNFPKVFSFDTYFFSTLRAKGYDLVKRRTRKVDIFSYDIIFVPVHASCHWILIAIDFMHKKIKYLDSLYQTHGSSYLEIIDGYMKKEALVKKKYYRFQDWKLRSVFDAPQQLNGSDCGVFIMKFAEYMSRKESLSFSQNNMEYFRERIAIEICRNSLQN